MWTQFIVSNKLLTLLSAALFSVSASARPSGFPSRWRLSTTMSLKNFCLSWKYFSCNLRTTILWFNHRSSRSMGYISALTFVVSSVISPPFYSVAFSDLERDFHPDLNSATLELSSALFCRITTVCPRSLGPFNIVTYLEAAVCTGRRPIIKKRTLKRLKNKVRSNFWYISCFLVQNHDISRKIFFRSGS